MIIDSVFILKMFEIIYIIKCKLLFYVQKTAEGCQKSYSLAAQRMFIDRHDEIVYITLVELHSYHHCMHMEI